MSTEGVQQPGLEDEDLLEGWKAIADHLNKTERTVQRWEKAKALPVRRLKSGSSEDQGRVFAYKTELDAWWQEMLTRPDELTPEPDRPPDHSPQPAPPPARPWHSSSFWVAIALAVILGVVTLLRMPDPAQNLRPQPPEVKSRSLSASSAI